MCEAINYIFENIKDSEKNIRIIKKHMCNQTFFNISMFLATLRVIKYFSEINLKISEQNGKIDKIKKEIEKMNCVEGV